MKTREMKEAMVQEVLTQLEQAKFWHHEWMETSIEDKEGVNACARLMDEAKERASQTLSMMVTFGWMTDEQRGEVYSDMLDEIYA